MRFDPDRHHRQSIRLRGFDYRSSGAYHLTLCAHSRAHLFGEVVEGEVQLTRAGQIVLEVWEGLPSHYAGVSLGERVVMPNHVHALIWLEREPSQTRAGLKPVPTGEGKEHPLAEVVRGSRTFSARAINAHRQTPGMPVWQRNYHERIIRNEPELERTRRSIEDNPLNWHLDEENMPNPV